MDTVESSVHIAHHYGEKIEYHPCYFCLEGWTFIGSVGHDGEEVIEYIRCRKCKGKGRIEILVRDQAASWGMDKCS